MSRRIGMLAAATAVLAAGTGLPDATSGGSVPTSNRYTFDAATHVLDLSLTSADDGATTLVVVRADGVIEPRFFVPGRFDGTTAPIPCGPATPTITTTDLIRVRVQGPGHPAGHWLRLVEADRPFAPGFSPGPGGTAEIELDVNVGSNASNALIVVGRGNADMSYAVGRLGVALNNDQDLDVALGGAATVSLDAGLGSGTSRFTGQGGFGTGEPTTRTLYLLGDRASADNTLIGGQGGDLLRGAAGDDVVRGAGGSDSLSDTTTTCCGDSGGGSDLLAGGSGNDGVSAEDYISDNIDGGAGFDRARIDRGLDRVQRVEDTSRGF